MTPERQRIAIAEWCGWTCQNQWWSHPTLPCNGGATIDPPDYLDDLNAMHEAEKSLFMPKTWETYVDWLIKIVGKFGSPINATAAQRAEALLRTVVDGDSIVLVIWFH